MSKAKAILLSLLAAFALSASASATASAGTSHVYLIEGTELASGSEAVEGDGLTGIVEVSIGGGQIILECKESIGSGTIKPKGESTGIGESKNCFVGNIEKGKKKYLPECSIEEPVKAEGKGVLVEHGVGEASSLTSTVTITGAKCVFATKYPVEGKQLCSTPEPTAVKVVHSTICTPAGSALTLKSAPAQSFGEGQAKLASKKGWSAT